MPRRKTQAARQPGGTVSRQPLPPPSPSLSASFSSPHAAPLSGSVPRTVSPPVVDVPTSPVSPPPPVATSSAPAARRNQRSSRASHVTPPPPSTSTAAPRATRSTTRQPTRVSPPATTPTQAAQQRRQRRSASPPLSVSSARAASPAAEPSPTEQPIDTTQPRSRQRLRKGKSRYCPNFVDLGIDMRFELVIHTQRYAFIRTLDIIPCRSVDVATLVRLQLYSEFCDLVDSFGWRDFFYCQYPAYVELCVEFYSTFEFIHSSESFSLSTPDAIRFRLMDRMCTFSVTSFNVALGVLDSEAAASVTYLDAFCDYPDEFDALAAYRMLTGIPDILYSPSRSKANLIKSATLRYIHRFLAYTFSGRTEDTTTLSKPELFFLWCMATRRRVNLGFWLASQFDSIIRFKRDMLLGSIITLLAVKLGFLNLDENNLHAACAMIPLDLTVLDSMGLLRREESGSFSFIPAGPILPRSQHVFRKRKATTDAPSSSAPPDVPPEASSSLVSRMERLEGKLDSLTTTVAEVHSVVHAVARHLGLTWPPPSA